MAQFIISAFADEASESLSGQIAALKRNGIGYIEPRNVCGNLIEKTDDELKSIAAELKKSGIGVSALGSPIGKFDIDKPLEEHLHDFRRAITACKILGTDRMRMFSFFVPQDKRAQYRDEVLKRLELLLDEAERENVFLCHENESAIYGQNPSEVKELLTELPRLKGIFDAANYVMNDQDPLEGLAATLPSIEYLHVKDARKQEKCMMPCGLGDGCYEEVLRRVDKYTDRTLTLTLEPHLYDFDAFKRIDKHTLNVGMSFSGADEAFDCAATALKDTLKKLGFHEENKVWKK